VMGKDGGEQDEEDRRVPGGNPGPVSIATRHERLLSERPDRLADGLCAIMKIRSFSAGVLGEDRGSTGILPGD
jgi:hypothetical protein